MQHYSKSILISKTQVGFYINQYCCQIKRVTYLALGVTTASDWPMSALTPPWYSRFHNQQQRDIQTSDEFSFPTIIKLLPLPGLRVTGWVSIKYGFPLRQPIVRTNGSLVNIAAKFHVQVHRGSNATSACLWKKKLHLQTAILLKSHKRTWWYVCPEGCKKLLRDHIF